MGKEEIKNKIHQLIDEIEDESALNMLYEDAVEYKSNASSLKEDELTEEQWAEIQEGIVQIERGEFFTHEEVQKKIAEWRNTK